MLLRSLAFAAIVSLGAFGCASRHTAMRGSVAMKVTETEAHVCLGKGEVSVDDRVQLFRDVCDRSGKRPVCHRQAVGEGVVTQLLNDHYSVVTFPTGTPFEEGYTVERSR
jgi:hypothetical protein